MAERGGRRGVFVSFEGIDGCGKTTLLHHLRERLERSGTIPVVTREPGGTILGEAIRELLLDPRRPQTHGWVEVLLYSASRVQQVHEVILPALDAGRWVLSDRFADATTAYQGYGRGLERDLIELLHRRMALDLEPDVTVLIDCDPETAAVRLGKRSGPRDRLEREAKAFHRRVREGYLNLAAMHPKRFLVLDGNRDLADVLAAFERELRLRLPGCPAL